MMLLIDYLTTKQPNKMRVLTQTNSRGRVKITTPYITISTVVIFSKIEFNIFEHGKYIALVELEEGLAIAVSNQETNGFKKVTIDNAVKDKTYKANYDKSNSAVLTQHKGRYKVVKIIEVDGMECLLIEPLLNQTK